MRSAFGEALIVGVGIGAAVIIIRALLGGAPVYMQLLAVLCAGMVLTGLQLALGRFRPRALRPAARERDRRAAEVSPSHTPPVFDDRNHAWTGLSTPAAWVVEPPNGSTTAAPDHTLKTTPPAVAVDPDAEPDGVPQPEPQPIENRAE